jgi:hypothetical protein
MVAAETDLTCRCAILANFPFRPRFAPRWRALVLALTSLLVVSSVEAQEQSVVQSKSFNIAASGTLGGNTYEFEHYEPSDGTWSIFNGFNPALGTLDALEINWNLTFSGQTANPQSEILVSGGVTTSDGVMYAPGTVSGRGTSVLFTSDETFQIGDPNIPFSPNTLAELTAPSTPGFEFTGTGSITGSPGDTFTASTVGEVTVTYFYTAAVPESGATGAILGAAVLVGGGIWSIGRSVPGARPGRMTSRRATWLPALRRESFAHGLKPGA